MPNILVTYRHKDLISCKNTNVDIQPLTSQQLYWNGGAVTPYRAGPLSGAWLLDSLNALFWDRFFRVDRSALEAHRSDWSDNGILDNPLPDIVGWPGRNNPHFASQYGFPLPDGELAPFVDVNGDGTYNAFDGDYPHPAALDPDILPGEMIWNVFNGAYGNFVGAPLGVEIQQTAWALACDDNDLLNESVFFSYRIVNRSDEPLDSVIAGIWAEPRLGGRLGDLWGTAPWLNSTIVYNATQVDTAIGQDHSIPFRNNPPAFSCTILNHPLYKSIYHVAGATCELFQLYSPSTPLGYYRSLNGHWRDGSSLLFGAYGSGPGIPTDFAFPDDPTDPNGWSMYNVSPSCATMVTVTSVYLNALAPDSFATIELAFSYHRGLGLNHLQNVSYAYDRIAQLKQTYDTHFSDACAYSSCASDCVWPGDLNRDGTVNPLDLLPLGVGWDSEGPERPGLITWAPHSAPDWGIPFNDIYDFKHLDANGNGVLNGADLGVINAFLGQKTPDYIAPPDEYPVGDGLWLVHFFSSTDPNNIEAGQQAGQTVYTANIPLDLYGIAFQIEYDTLYWTQKYAKPGGFNGAVKTEFKNAGNIMCAHVYIDQVSAFESNKKLYNTILRAKSIPDSLPDTTFVRLKNIRGIRADGAEIALGANRLRYCFGGGCAPSTAVNDLPTGEIDLFPNPATGPLTLLAPGRTWQSTEIFDLTGRLLRRWDEPAADQMTLDLSGLPSGWMLLRVQGGGRLGRGAAGVAGTLKARFWAHKLPRRHRGTEILMINLCFSVPPQYQF